MDLIPSTTQSQALLIPSQMVSIRFLPQLNASLNRFEKKSPMLENRLVIPSHIHSQTLQIPFQMLTKNPLIPSQQDLKMPTIVSPTSAKNAPIDSPKPLMNSQIPIKTFFIASQILIAKLFMYSHASDQSPRSKAHTALMMSIIACTTSITACKNGPSAWIIPEITLVTTPHNVITSPPIRSNTGFRVSYRFTIVSQSDANSCLMFSHIGRK